MKDWMEERLRRLDIGRPDPAVRRKVLQAAETVLAETREPWSWRAWLAAWRVEALLTAGVAMAAIFSLSLEPLSVRGADPLPRFARVSVASLAEGPHPEQELQAYYQARRRWAVRNPAAKRRVGHDHQTDVLEEYWH